MHAVRATRPRLPSRDGCRAPLAGCGPPGALRHRCEPGQVARPRDGAAPAACRAPARTRAGPTGALRHRARARAGERDAMAPRLTRRSIAPPATRPQPSGGVRRARAPSAHDDAQPRVTTVIRRSPARGHPCQTNPNSSSPTRRAPSPAPRATSARSAASSSRRRWSPPWTRSPPSTRRPRPTRPSPPSSNDLMVNYTGRPSALTEVPRFAEHAGGARVFLKREDLNHTGSHKINNVLGQALLTRRMGKTRVIAETGAGQHGVATATACALFGLECTIYMGEVDTERQALNVARMRMLGAEVVAGEVRQPHPEGRHQRGVPRLGRQRRPHPLPLRHRRGTAPLPGAGPRLPPGDRRRGAPPDAGARRAAARTRRSPASAAAPTRWASSTPSCPTRASGWSAASPPATAWRPASTRPP